MASPTVYLVVLIATTFGTGYGVPTTPVDNPSEQEPLPNPKIGTGCCSHPAYQVETNCCPEACCRPGMTVGGCCEQKSEIYKSPATHYHHNFVGIKLFLSFKLTTAQWAESLTDHYSDDFNKLAGMVVKALKFYSLIPGAVIPKVVTFSAADTGSDVIANVVVKIPWRENQEELLAFFERSLKRDIQQTGILDTDLDVDEGSLVIHDIERRGGSEEQKHCCHNEAYATTCCPESCCVAGSSVIECCPKKSGRHRYLKPVILCHGVTSRYVIRIKGEWVPALQDPESAAFEDLESKLAEGFKQLFGRFRDYAGVDVISFRQDGTADVIAKFDLKIIDTVGAVPCHLEKDLLSHVLRIVLEEAVFTDGTIGTLNVDVLSLIMPQKLHAKFTTDELKPRWKPFCNVLNDDKKGQTKSIVHQPTVISKKKIHALPVRHDVMKAHTTTFNKIPATFTKIPTKKSEQPVEEKKNNTEAKQ